MCPLLARGVRLYPFDSEITAQDAARLLNREYATIRSWATRYNVPRVGRTRQGCTLYDFRILAAIEKAIRNCEPVPHDWSAFALRLVGEPAPAA